MMCTVGKYLLDLGRDEWQIFVVLGCAPEVIRHRRRQGHHHPISQDRCC